MPDGQIFKATYSGVPVYEMMCKGIAVMRRRADGWLNATQILKVAGFDKPQRTRVLERDVQKGEHEKVQGGYGKYQGTWIPLERGLALAKQYNCEYLLRPIIDFQPEAKSPPLAPKHLVSSVPGNKAAARRAADAASTQSSVRARRREEPISDEDISMRGSDEGSATPSPSDISSASPTPSPIRETPDGIYDSDGGEDKRYPPHARSPRRKAHKRPGHGDDSGSDEEVLPNGSHEMTYSDQILEYFISDSSQVPQFLINPPNDFDPNVAIDDDGHTALHWASAMGRIRVVKLLLSAGADIFKVNKSGQTALMRSVMFANNYDVRKFPELYELLHKSTLNIDNFNRTVFHHIVDIAMSKGKTHAARYYMETILQRLAEYPKELADIINFQDEDGETALTMAARCRSKRLVKLLIDHGADPKITNRDSKSTEDYILEDERFRSSPTIPSRTTNMSFQALQASYLSQGNSSNNADVPTRLGKPSLRHSITAQIASTRCINDMAVMLESLASSFDQELREKERDMSQAQSLFSSIQSEILESQRSVSQLRQQSGGLEETKEMLEQQKENLRRKMGQRYRLGWEKWLMDEEERERMVREMSLGKDIPHVPGAISEGTPDRMDASTGKGSAEVDRTQSPPKGKGKLQISENEDVSDLHALYSDLPADEGTLQKVCNALRDELEQSKTRRRDMFGELVKLQAEAGTSGRMNQYRRLISAGCGGLPPDEVEVAITTLLETLESEEPGVSVIPWNDKSNRPRVAVGG